MRCLEIKCHDNKFKYRVLKILIKYNKHFYQKGSFEKDLDTGLSKCPNGAKMEQSPRLI